MDYKLHIDSVTVLPNDNGYLNSIRGVDYTMYCFEDDGAGGYYISSTSGDFKFEPDDPYVNYEEVNEEIMVDWVLDALGTISLQSIFDELSRELTIKKNESTLVVNTDPYGSIATVSRMELDVISKFQEMLAEEGEAS